MWGFITGCTIPKVQGQLRTLKYINKLERFCESKSKPIKEIILVFVKSIHHSKPDRFYAPFDEGTLKLTYISSIKTWNYLFLRVFFFWDFFMKVKKLKSVNKQPAWMMGIKNISSYRLQIQFCIFVLLKSVRGRL